jgi:hypothetical protein
MYMLYIYSQWTWVFVTSDFPYTFVIYISHIKLQFFKKLYRGHFLTNVAEIFSYCSDGMIFEYKWRAFTQEFNDIPVWFETFKWKYVFCKEAECCGILDLGLRYILWSYLFSTMSFGAFRYLSENACPQPRDILIHNEIKQNLSPEHKLKSDMSYHNDSLHYVSLNVLYTITIRPYGYNT